jgi:uncharacterized protein
VPPNGETVNPMCANLDTFSQTGAAGEPYHEKANLNGTSGIDHAGGVARERKPYDYGSSFPRRPPREFYYVLTDAGGNPLAHVRTNDPDLRLPAFGGEFQPGLYR